MQNLDEMQKTVLKYLNKISKTQMKIISIVVLVFVIMLLFFSCSHKADIADLKSYVEKLRHESIKHLNASSKKEPDLHQPASIAYHADTLRPPFGEAAKAKETGVTTKVNQSNPLLAYSVSVIKFLGTLKQKGIIFAFILAPDGVIYQVKAGDEIDDHHGKVLEIKEREMTVREGLPESGIGIAGKVVTLQLRDEH